MKWFYAVAALFLTLYLFTGFLQNNIDYRDSKYWDYEDGIIKNANSFEIKGDEDTCWILIHGYASTPDEMRELGKRINQEFNDSVYAPLLPGHGTYASELQETNMNDWYETIDEIELCNKTNVIGSSYGSVLTLKLAEEKKLKNIYLLNTFLNFTDYNINLQKITELTYWNLKYIKKPFKANINFKEGEEKFITYWNMPLKPIKSSRDFIKDTEERVWEIEEKAFIAHSINDNVADYRKAIKIHEILNSEIKWYDKSDHILLFDYEKKELIQDIISFEKRNR